MQQSDVIAVRFNADGQMVPLGQRVRVKGISIAGAGLVSLRDGGPAGPPRIILDAVAPGVAITLPGEGVVYADGVHLTLGGATGVTIFYG